jgi:hypothetical protein
VRALIHMGAGEPSHSETVSREWQELARDLVSPGYREAMGRFTGPAVLVRSDDSWHAVSRVVDGSESSRRSVTFYKPGSVSTMWPPGEEPALHPYPPASS